MNINMRVPQVSHFINGLKWSNHDHGASCAVDALLELFYYGIYKHDAFHQQSDSTDGLCSKLISTCIAREAYGADCSIREQIWMDMVNVLPHAYYPQGWRDAEILAALQTVALTPGPSFQTEHAGELHCCNPICSNTQNFFFTASALHYLNDTLNNHCNGNIARVIEESFHQSIMQELMFRRCDGCLDQFYLDNFQSQTSRFLWSLWDSAMMHRTCSYPKWWCQRWSLFVVVSITCEEPFKWSQGISLQSAKWVISLECLMAAFLMWLCSVLLLLLSAGHRIARGKKFCRWRQGYPYTYVWNGINSGRAISQCFHGIGFGSFQSGSGCCIHAWCQQIIPMPRVSDPLWRLWCFHGIGFGSFQSGSGCCIHAWCQHIIPMPRVSDPLWRLWCFHGIGFRSFQSGSGCCIHAWCQHIIPMPRVSDPLWRLWCFHGIGFGSFQSGSGCCIHAWCQQIIFMPRVSGPLWRLCCFHGIGFGSFQSGSGCCIHAWCQQIVPMPRVSDPLWRLWCFHGIGFGSFQSGYGCCIHAWCQQSISRPRVSDPLWRLWCFHGIGFRSFQSGFGCCIHAWCQQIISMPRDSGPLWRLWCFHDIKPFKPWVCTTSVTKINGR